jgi:hypothetical protein
MPQAQIGNRYGVTAAQESASTAKVIRFTGNASGGNNFQLRVGDATTANIPRLATATQLRDALRALPAIGTGGVNASGGPLGTAPIDVTLAGKLQGVDLALPVFVNVDLTGGTVTIVQQTARVLEAYNNANLQTINDMDAVLAISGFSQAYLDRLTMNDKLFAIRQIGEPWNIG